MAGYQMTRAKMFQPSLTANGQCNRTGGRPLGHGNPFQPSLTANGQCNCARQTVSCQGTVVSTLTDRERPVQLAGGQAPEVGVDVSTLTDRERPVQHDEDPPW